MKTLRPLLLAAAATVACTQPQTVTTVQAPAPAPAVELLTEREREVVALVAEGLSNDEIAERLFMSSATARTHVSRAMIKVGARDRAQLVVFAYETGLARPGWA